MRKWKTMTGGLIKNMLKLIIVKIHSHKHDNNNIKGCYYLNGRFLYRPPRALPPECHSHNDIYNKEDHEGSSGCPWYGLGRKTSGSNESIYTQCIYPFYIVLFSMETCKHDQMYNAVYTKVPNKNISFMYISARQVLGPYIYTRQHDVC